MSCPQANEPAANEPAGPAVATSNNSLHRFTLPVVRPPIPWPRFPVARKAERPVSLHPVLEPAPLKVFAALPNSTQQKGISALSALSLRMAQDTAAGPSSSQVIGYSRQGTRA